MAGNRSSSQRSAWQIALNYLSSRPRSRGEVRDRLEKAACPADEIEETLAKLTDLGYLDDEAFARLWVEDRINFKPEGRYRLYHELTARQVDPGTAQKVLEELLPPEKEAALAFELARSRLARRKMDPARLQAFLYRRGFNRSAVAAAADRAGLWGGREERED